MFKKIFMTSSIALAMALALPAFAQTGSVVGTTNASTTNASNAKVSKIACVGVAVNTRETAIQTGIAAYAQALQNAYVARVNALQEAYTGATAARVKVAVKSAWSTFAVSIKTATKAWKTARTNAWTQFRTAYKACKAPVSVSDSANAYSEVIGQ